MASPTTLPTASAVDGLLLVARVSRPLIPFLFLLSIVAYIGRVNVAFAGLRMKHDLGLGKGSAGGGKPRVQ